MYTAGVAEWSYPTVAVDSSHGEVVLVSFLELCQRTGHGERECLHIAHLQYGTQ